MSEPKWTKGPWIFAEGDWNQSSKWNQPDRLDTEYSVGSIRAADGTYVAALEDLGSSEPQDVEEQRANARVMAAAPNLYEALALYVEHFGDPLKVARPALAKARGEA